ncbi:glycoside hydrolase family 26 protein [Neolewinella antarctica]|uniref:Mannan endo-1,4-beta-mannosidase n=1 Tax=Neolewinella antarctica TaxID=442734 RepID=A0ABX0XH56_9BACT|nr:glycosyl hydrolase [Neolewinella antarctica]NJC28234.1 mannan endo-1,4-beta-mannosidase [Neolewinella antarctica]
MRFKPVFFHGLLLACVCLWQTCSVRVPGKYQQIATVDAEATKQTKALFANLRTVAKDRILFGQQDALAYGVGWKDWHKMKSDVDDICGQQPAVFGWDMGQIGKKSYNLDTVDFQQMQGWMKRVYKMGGINTVSWHSENYVTGGTSWDVGDRVVAAILPGGSHHGVYKKSLDDFADFMADVEVGFLFKEKVPIIFRPFHEHTGGWFWWGKGHCTPEEYKAIWQFTVEYLRDVKGLDNLLYAYSPDVFRDEAHFLECYPGDAYVDILGVDNYYDFSVRGNVEDVAKRLRTVVELANEKGKVAALTETGVSGIPEDKWWTEKLLKQIKTDPIASQIAWVLVWRNSRLDHHYAPYPGHPSAPDFIEFCNDPVIIMEDRLPKIYELD